MFPEFRELIEQLRQEGRHQRFLHLYERHRQLDQELMELSKQDSGSTHHEIDSMKREKLRMKDQLYQILREEAAARP